MTTTINADNGAVSGSAGLKSSADATGVLALQTNGTTAVTVDASQRVGIGTASPATKLNISSAGADVEVRASTTTSGNVRFGFDADGAYYNWIQTNRSSGAIQFAISNSEVVQINAVGGLKVINTIGVGNATPSTSGAGITFPATQSASTNANTLDDYEEGTWTPSIGGTATYTNQTGQYTRIGRLVSVIAFIWIGIRGTGSTGQITGLPFTQTGNIAPISIAYYDSSATSLSSVLGYFNSGTVNVAGVPAGGSTGSTDPVNIFQNGTQLYFSCTYYTTT